VNVDSQRPSTFGQFHKGRSLKGSALISALAVVAVASLMLTGICLLATSHASRQRQEADYELALQLAESGINYELNYMSANQAACTTSSQSIPGVTGSYTVTATNADGSPWTSPQPATITATGTVGSMTRKVRVSAKSSGTSLFAANPVSNGTLPSSYSVFGVRSVTMTHNGAALNGNIGTNGSMNLSGSADLAGTGLVVTAGPSAVLVDYAGIPAARERSLASAVIWPTIDTIVASKFPLGWASLSGATGLASQSGHIRKFVGTASSTLSPSNTTLANWPVSGTAATTINTTVLGAYPQSAIILTPGDYYMTSIVLTAGNKLVLDTQNVSTGGAPGQINIWMSGSTTDDAFTATGLATAVDPTMFRVYYNKAATFSLNASSSLAGGIYAVRAGNNLAASPASVTMTASATATVAVIADVATLNKDTTVQLPNNTLTGGLSNSADYQVSGSGQFAFEKSWIELAATGGSVFSDGSNN